ncbi:MAG: SDR family oxidoreductase [Chitinophagales bacterium]
MYQQAYQNEKIEGLHFLVTGGAGFIGSHIAEYLLQHGAKVRVIDNMVSGLQSNIDLFSDNPNYEFIEGDIRDLEFCKKVCRGIDYISHQAALGSVPRSLAEPENTNASNVDGYLNMLIAAKENKVKRIVYASSSSVYGDSQGLPKVENEIGNQLSPYAVSKYTNELYAHVFRLNFDMKIIGLRYFNVFGPRQNPDGPYAAVIPLFVDGLLNEKPVYIDGDGEQTRDFTFVANAVQANIKALFAPWEKVNDYVFNVAVGENFSVNTMFDAIKKELDSVTNATYREPRKGDVRNSLADISRAKNQLGYNPEFDFHEGLKQTVNYFKTVYSN